MPRSIGNCKLKGCINPGFKDSEGYCCRSHRLEGELATAKARIAELEARNKNAEAGWLGKFRALKDNAVKWRTMLDRVVNCPPDGSSAYREDEAQKMLSEQASTRKIAKGK